MGTNVKKYDYQAIVEELKKGARAKEVSDRYGCSIQTVYKVCRKLIGKLPKKKASPERLYPTQEEITHYLRTRKLPPDYMIPERWFPDSASY